MTIKIDNDIWLFVRVFGLMIFGLIVMLVGGYVVDDGQDTIHNMIGGILIAGGAGLAHFSYLTDGFSRKFIRERVTRKKKGEKNETF